MSSRWRRIWGQAGREDLQPGPRSSAARTLLWVSLDKSLAFSGSRLQAPRGVRPQRGAGLRGEAFGAARHLHPSDAEPGHSRGCQCPTKHFFQLLLPPDSPLLSLASFSPEQRLLLPEMTIPTIATQACSAGVGLLGKVLHTQLTLNNL